MAIWLTLSDGTEYFDGDEALAYLLRENVVFSNSRRYLEGDTPQPETIVLFVLCNDIFAWGCADAEPLPYAELETLTRMCLADPKWGSAKWCCIRRQEKPQPPVEKAMRKDGVWDETMQALPDNMMDREVAAAFAAVQDAVSAHEG